MRDPIDLLTSDRPLAPDEQTALDRALAADPGLGEAAAQFDQLRRHVRSRLEERLPDPSVLVLHALAGTPGALTLDEHARLTAADVPGAAAVHPGVAAAVRRLADDREAFETAWADALADASVPAEVAVAPRRSRHRMLDRTAARSTRNPVARWMWRGVATTAVAAFVAVLVMVQQRDAGWATLTARAEQTVQLPDGSSALLAAGTRLRIPGAGNHVRQVRLEQGQAVFRIVHDPSAPFTVHTPNAEVTVLGTTFNVEATQTGALAQTAVVLIDGTVTLAPRAQPAAAVRLVPGTASRVLNLDTPAPPAPADVAAALAWTGNVEARNERADNVAARLGERFGVVVEVSPLLAGEWVSGTFDARDGAADAVRKLALALDGHLERAVGADGRPVFRIEGR